MAILTCAHMYEDTNKVKNVFFARLGGVVDISNVVKAHVNRIRECEMVVNLPSTEIVQIEFKTLEMEDHIVRYVFEARSGLISLGFSYM